MEVKQHTPDQPKDQKRDQKRNLKNIKTDENDNTTYEQKQHTNT